MNVRSKWQCISVKKYKSGVWDTKGQKVSDGFLHTYEFQAVTCNSEENIKFFASTPSGNITMAAVRDDLYVPGEYYYFDSTPASESVSASA